MKFFQKLKPRAGNMDLRIAAQNMRIVAEHGYGEVFVKGSGGFSLGEGIKIDPERTIAIVGAGPSARSEEGVAALAARKDRSGKRMMVVLAGAGYTRLGDGFKHADAVVLNHPNSLYVAGVPGVGARDLPYYVCSMAPAGAEEGNPSVFDAISGYGHGDNIRLWHAYVDGMEEPNPDQLAMTNPSGATGAAMLLYAAMYEIAGHKGKLKIEFFGMDGTADYKEGHMDNPAFHVWLENLKADQVAVRVGGGVHMVAREYWHQTLEILDFLEHYPDAIQSLHFHGTSVNAALFNTPDEHPRLAEEIRRSHEVIEGEEPGVEPGLKHHP